MKHFLYLSLATLISCKEYREEKMTTAAIKDFNAEVEKASIMNTIKGETGSFFKGNYDEWKQHYIQSDYAFQGYNNADGTFEASQGWVTIDKKVGDYIKAQLLTGSEQIFVRVERKNFVVKFFSDKVAYLTWDQYNGKANDNFYNRSKEVRVMEKENGRWKIVTVCAMWDYKNKIPVDSLN
jgi:hypothetical protein